MTTFRKIAFINNNFYHVFNRGVEKRPVFTSKKEYDRAISLIRFYQYVDTPVRYSQFLQKSYEEQISIMINFMGKKTMVEINAYSLMPNHFHFLLKQNTKGGISRFISLFTNSYTRYFNTKHNRIGPLFQGTFKAVFVEDDEQLLHLSRYIHLNPIVSSVVLIESLENHPYSSYQAYVSDKNDGITKKDLISSMFQSKDSYRNFVHDQIHYSKELDKIKHLVF